MEKPESERINIFHAFLQIKAGEGGGAMDANTIKEVHKEAERLEVTNKAPLVLCEVLLTGDKVVEKIKTHKIMFVKFTNENQKVNIRYLSWRTIFSSIFLAQAQKYLLGGIEKLIEMKRDLLLPKVAGIFKILYDEDILDEEVHIQKLKSVIIPQRNQSPK